MNHRLTIPFWAGLALLLLAGACAPLATGAQSEGGSGEPPPQDEGAAEDDEPGDAELEKLVRQATADLAQRLEVGEDSVELLRAERVTWRDSSLGCPEPGMMYMQALQPGVLIELRVDEEVYRYHSTPEGPPFYCETPSSKEPLPADPDE